ncbi:MAG: hypothetical protein ABIS17_04035 [Casimicrobiaceae bacterium]
MGEPDGTKPARAAPRQRWSMFGSIAAIGAAGTIGAIAAWLVTSALDLSGTGGALLTVLLGMVIAVAAFVLGVWVRDALTGRQS